jgi:hypothetical protein
MGIIFPPTPPPRHPFFAEAALWVAVGHPMALGSPCRGHPP